MYYIIILILNKAFTINIFILINIKTLLIVKLRVLKMLL